MYVFVHAQGIKTVHARGGGQKMAKFCPRSYWMTLYPNLSYTSGDCGRVAHNWVQFERVEGQEQVSLEIKKKKNIKKLKNYL